MFAFISLLVYTYAGKGAIMNKLKQIREFKGVSQSMLSEASGVSLRMIQQYEQGKKNIDGAHLKTLVSLSSCLDCGISDIINDEGIIEKLRELKI